MELEKIVPFILSFEGGYVNDPADRGGATNMGVTFGTLRKYREKKGLPAPSMGTLRNLTREEWTDILRTRFWDLAGCPLIEDAGLCAMLCDFAWHSGPAQAGLALQLAYRDAFPSAPALALDGVVGKNTAAAVNSVPDRRAFFERYRDRRLGFLRSIVIQRPSQRKYEKGWVRRVNAIGWDSLTPNGGKAYRIP